MNYIETHLNYRYHMIVFANQTAKLELITIVITCVLNLNDSLSASEIFFNNL